MLKARKCQRCGKAPGVFAFTLVRHGRPERGYYHPWCFTAEKCEAEEPEEEEDEIECLACGKDCGGACDRRYEEARDCRDEGDAL